MPKGKPKFSVHYTGTFGSLLMPGAESRLTELPLPFSADHFCSGTLTVMNLPSDIRIIRGVIDFSEAGQGRWVDFPQIDLSADQPAMWIQVALGCRVMVHFQEPKNTLMLTPGFCLMGKVEHVGYLPCVEASSSAEIFGLLIGFDSLRRLMGGKPERAPIAI